MPEVEVRTKCLCRPCYRESHVVRAVKKTDGTWHGGPVSGHKLLGGVCRHKKDEQDL